LVSNGGCRGNSRDEGVSFLTSLTKVFSNTEETVVHLADLAEAKVCVKAKVGVADSTYVVIVAAGAVGSATEDA
jgi:hypothetical protein